MGCYNGYDFIPESSLSLDKCWAAMVLFFLSYPMIKYGNHSPSYISTDLEWNKREIWIIIKFCLALTKCEMKFKRGKLIINKFWGVAANSWQKQSKVVSICVALTRETEQIKLVKIVGLIIVAPVCIVIAWVLSYDTISYTY